MRSMSRQQTSYFCEPISPALYLLKIEIAERTAVKRSNVVPSDGVDAVVSAMPSAGQCSVIHARRRLHA